jgi:hypothetical protein
MAANLSGAPDDPANLIHVGAIDSKEDRALIGVLEHDLRRRSSPLRPRRKPLRAALRREAADGGRRSRADRRADRPEHAVLERRRVSAPRRTERSRTGRRRPPLSTPLVRSVRAADGDRRGSGVLRVGRNGRDREAADLSGRAAGGRHGVRSLHARLGRGSTTSPVEFARGSRRARRTMRTPSGRPTEATSSTTRTPAPGRPLQKPTHGGGSAEPLLEGEGQRIADDWSPDGRSSPWNSARRRETAE